MATQVQYRRGTEAQNDAFTGALGEMTIDTTNGTMRVHNGVTAGGSNIATVAYVTTALSTLDSSKIYNGTSNVSVASANGPVSFFVNSSAIIRVTASGIETKWLMIPTMLDAMTSPISATLMGRPIAMTDPKARTKIRIAARTPSASDSGSCTS